MPSRATSHFAVKGFSATPDTLISTMKLPRSLMRLSLVRASSPKVARTFALQMPKASPEVVEALALPGAASRAAAARAGASFSALRRVAETIIGRYSSGYWAIKPDGMGNSAPGPKVRGRARKTH